MGLFQYWDSEKFPFVAESPRHSFLVIMDWLSHTGQGPFSSCLGDYSGEILQQKTHKGILTRPKTFLIRIRLFRFAELIDLWTKTEFGSWSQALSSYSTHAFISFRLVGEDLNDQIRLKRVPLLKNCWNGPLTFHLIVDWKRDPFSNAETCAPKRALAHPTKFPWKVGSAAPWMQKT